MPSTQTPGERLSNIKRVAFLVWAIIGIGLIVAACGYVLGQVWTSVEVVLFAAFLVFVLRTPVAWMERIGIPRGLGAGIAYLLAFIVIVAVALLFIPMLSEQVVGFTDLLPGYVSDATVFFSNLYERYYEVIQDDNIHQVIVSLSGELSRWATEMASNTAGGLVDFGTSVASTVMVLFVSIVAGFWVLKDLPRISREILVIVGPKLRTDAIFIAHAFSRSLGGYLKGMVVAGICTGTMAGICYYFIGLPYPLVLGLLTGLLNFIPFLGPWIAGILVAILGLFISPLTAFLAIVGTIVPQMITDNLISPRVMAGRVELHPSIILVVLMAGGALAGIFGMLCAIPLAAAVKSIFAYYFERRTSRRVISRDGAFFKGRPTLSDDPFLDESGVVIADEELVKSHIGEHEQRALDAAVRVRKKPVKRPKLAKTAKIAESEPAEKKKAKKPTAEPKAGSQKAQPAEQPQPTEQQPQPTEQQPQPPDAAKAAPAADTAPSEAAQEMTAKPNGDQDNEEF